jgi:hypothetical protein
LQSFFAFPTSFNGGAYVASGDVNGDGLADIVAGAGPGGGPQVAIFDGSSGALLASFYDPVLSSSPIPGGVAPGVRVGAVRVNNQEQLLLAGGIGVPPLVNIYSALPLVHLDSFFAFDPGFLGGVFVGG